MAVKAQPLYNKARGSDEARQQVAGILVWQLWLGAPSLGLLSGCAGAVGAELGRRLPPGLHLLPVVSQSTALAF